MPHDIFLSYRRSDEAYAGQLIAAIERRNLSAWWDQKIEGGEDWRDAIVENLADSRALVILFSEDCNQSKQLRKELAVADALDKTVVPVLIEDTKPKGHFLYELAALNWLRAFPDPEQKIEGLVDRLIRELGLTAFSAEDIPPDPEPAATAPLPAVDAVPPLEADEVRKIAREEDKANKADRRRWDFLPFKWYEVLIAMAWGATGLTSTTTFDPDTGEWMFVSGVVNALSGVTLGLLFIALVVFPFRYFFRGLRAMRAAGYYVASVTTLAIGFGVVIGIRSSLGGDLPTDDSAILSIVTTAVGSIVMFGFISAVMFSIYGLLHFYRTVRNFYRNVEPV